MTDVPEDRAKAMAEAGYSVQEVPTTVELTHPGLKLVAAVRGDLSADDLAVLTRLAENFARRHGGEPAP